MTDNELKDECMENAEIDLRRYSNNELTQIREAMRMYAARKLKLFAIPDVVGRSEQLKAFREWYDSLSQEESAWYEGRYEEVFLSL